MNFANYQPIFRMSCHVHAVNDGPARGTAVPEEGVREEVEHGASIGADTRRKNNVTQREQVE